MRSTITVKEAAEKLGVHEDTIYTMVRYKQIPHVRIRKRIVFRSDALDAWMERQEVDNCKVVV